MSYFFRQQYHFSKDAGWDESKHPRGKTTPESTPGSFAPAGGSDDLLVMHAPPKDKPVVMVFGGSFNPPHMGHLQTAAKALELMEAAGYNVRKVVIAPSADKLLSAKPAKEGEVRFNLQERAELVREFLASHPKIEVSTVPAEEAEAFQGKLKRVHLAQSTQRQHPDATVVNITGQDQADMATVPRFPALFTGDEGTSHHGYYYIALPRDMEEGISSSKIRAALKEGREIPEDFMPKNVQERMRLLISNQRGVKKSWLEIIKEAAWREEEHPRGKTTPKTNAGSFTHKEGGKATEAPPVTSAQQAEHYVVYNGTKINKRLVQGSDNPAQMLQAMYGGMASTDQILEELRGRVSHTEWEAFVEASNAAKKFVDEGGDSRQRHATRVEDGEGGHVWNYDETRKSAVHQPILDMYMEKYKKLAEQSTGDPEFIVLAGRGGSGKSSFGLNRSGEVDQRFFGFYDRSYLEINPDDVKIALRNAVRASGLYGDEGDLNPEGDAAGYWHEESSDLTKRIQAMIWKHIDDNPDAPKANIVLDLTLANKKTEPVQNFVDRGYRATLAGIFIPATESAYGALSRWQGRRNDAGEQVRGRLVGVKYIGDSKNNERNFDEMIRDVHPKTGKPLVSSWALYTGGSSQAVRPILVASGGKRRPRGNS